MLKLLYTQRTSECSGNLLLDEFDKCLRDGITRILNVYMNHRWPMAPSLLPVRNGRLGIRSASKLAPSTFWHPLLPWFFPRCNSSTMLSILTRFITKQLYGNLEIYIISEGNTITCSESMGCADRLQNPSWRQGCWQQSLHTLEIGYMQHIVQITIWFCLAYNSFAFTVYTGIVKYKKLRYIELYSNHCDRVQPTVVLQMIVDYAVQVAVATVAAAADCKLCYVEGVISFIHLSNGSYNRSYYDITNCCQLINEA